jgi:hypothetical protein
MVILSISPTAKQQENLITKSALKSARWPTYKRLTIIQNQMLRL